MTKPDYRALCDELLDELHLWSSWHDAKDLKDRAGAALDLAQPELVAPTDEELYELWEESGFENDRFARAVLARWGCPTPQPVPVSERMPGPEDCDEQGRCWIFMPDIGTDPSSLLADPRDIGPYHTHWLPANALPNPEAND